ncbi:DNA/RNA non-specific endonuclease [Priestia aryabhattai]|uniref:DNA/RNA non-specific endonuclease n=1 Tax=Priestia aryabhattai TaxID=412384 RepID=UPI001ADD563D|nr:DNA/RNA non-specific endonuclease [Priestia aryabhattai]QTL47334.1 DNA/RNA non-specific endonuclease [Priestia aryabhattai]
MAQEKKKGFDTKFLGDNYEIPFPRLTGTTAENALNNGEIFNFIHFSLVMNKKLKFAIYGANNIDQAKAKDVPRVDFHFDPYIGEENQVGNELYRNNPWDRGHIVRRRDVCWGNMEEAKQANYDSFSYANISLQHHNFNTKPWNQLEDWILEHPEHLNKKLSVFTGPINAETDREYCGVGRPNGCGIRIPAAFWKIVFYVGLNNNLGSAAFIMKQDEFWNDEHSSNLIPLETYQVPLNTISQLTGIEFKDALYNTNPLFFSPNVVTESENIITPEARIIHNASDLTLSRNLR